MNKMVDNIKTVELAVGGMTCSRCSDAVKTALLDLPGIQNVSVSLSTNLAHVQYIESPDCTVDIIREEIEDIGYDVNDIIIPKEEKTVKKIQLAVGGMTCSMCSSAVQAALMDTPGVISVNVSLSTNLATVEFEPSPDCSTESLTDTIECIGYDVNDVLEKEDGGEDDTEEGGADTSEVNDGDDRLQRIIRQQNGQLAARRRAFLWSFLGALPILSITMVLPKVLSKECFLIQYLHTDVVIFNHSFVLESLLLWLFTTPVQFFCGYSFYKTSFYGIRRGILGMDVLVALGTTASYIYAVMATWARDPSYRFFETSAVLICFVLLGKWMNAMAICRTSEALVHLMKLQAKTALKVSPDKKDINEWNPLVDSYQEKTVSIQKIHPGDIVKVLKGASIPADGVLMHGEMSVDESMITGESMPVLKTPGAQVLGGTICSETGSGILKAKDTTAAAFIRVTGVGSSTALAQIVQLVQDAQSRQVPIQNLADTIAGIFVPSVVVISFLTFLIWYGCCKTGVVPPSWYEGESPATFALLFGIASLVISCPCALGLATPSAIMVGTGVGAQCGVLMKGGETLEVASKVDTVIFDKTGTLTKGKPVVTDLIRVINDEGLSKIINSEPYQMDGDNYLIWLFGSLERNSEHPLASAFVSYAEERLHPLLQQTPFGQPSNFLALTGRGAAGMINGVKVSIGNRAFAEHEHMQVSEDVERTLRDLEAEGKTGMLAGVNGIVCAVIGVADELKDEARASIDCLRNMGLDIWMVTGDSKRTAVAIAKSLNLPSNRVISEALPVTKVDTVRRLQSEGHIVAMVGDGVNDSPALAEADVGMSMGTGAEIATEASDLILVRGKVSDVCVALDLSKVIFRRIQWNLVFSLIYNLLSIPLAAGVFFPIFHTRLPPTVAAVAMSLSSTSVVFSSLALRFYKPKNVFAPPRRRHLPRFLRMNPRHEYSEVQVEELSETDGMVAEIV
jgi:Cu+-exporting ATPase